MGSSPRNVGASGATSHNTCHTLTIYSRELFARLFLPGGVGVQCFTVPVTEVFVIRDVAVWCAAPGTTYENGSAVNGFYFADDGTVRWWQLLDPGPVVGVTYHWEGRQVFEAGSSCTFNPLDQNWSVRMCGYIFTS